eukprot:362589-Chlamydomonas_euryale.AAC.3
MEESMDPAFAQRTQARKQNKPQICMAGARKRGENPSLAWHMQGRRRGAPCLHGESIGVGHPPCRPTDGRQVEDDSDCERRLLDQLPREVADVGLVEPDVGHHDAAHGHGTKDHAGDTERDDDQEQRRQPP